MTVNPVSRMDPREFLKIANAQLVRAFHRKDDVDSGPQAHHHTLGPGFRQAAPGSLVKTVHLLSTSLQVFLRQTKVAAQSIPDSTFTLVTFPTAVNSTDFITVNGTSDTFTVTEAGIYDVKTYVTWAAAASGRRILRIEQNGVETARVNITSATEVSQHLADTLSVFAGDTLQIVVNHNSGVPIDVTLGTLTIKRLA